LAVLLAATALPLRANSENSSLPKSVLPPGADFYPATLKRRQVQGRVEYEFLISANGSAINLRATTWESLELVQAGAALIRSLRFELPDSWNNSDAAQARYFVTVSFQLPADDAECKKTEPLSPNSAVFDICARRVAQPLRR
jgi:hypothetical protein